MFQGITLVIMVSLRTLYFCRLLFSSTAQGVYIYINRYYLLRQIDKWSAVPLHVLWSNFEVKHSLLYKQIKMKWITWLDSQGLFIT